ncbi:MAG: GNAT family N-acetyltransferase [Acidobacteria bacterium]|nr:MAG: GNAT family N-acetyltransferase [Acidobacteriota bacterium]HMC54572.1 N-acetyltransferase [Gemmatimonadaceae bacterium]
MNIRPEREADTPAIRRVNLAAFETSKEAELVDALREQAAPLVSLVAEDAGAIVGHILFSPVTLIGHPEITMMGLAPMAVMPARQRQGIGSALVRDGLDACKRLGASAVVVVGHAAYYPRFGFTPASRFGIRCEYDVPDDVFMMLEISAGGLQGKSGIVRYHSALASA